ncbi:MAG: aminotransferase class I/II-fold pyridoxal phosphate-dependent enzyme [Lachnospiraceae bacterium]|nr:aminotransferase class I/II-fold pyridoxal phosphate-dependent enzyme [Lachnospiraceae bacterium]
MDILHFEHTASREGLATIKELYLPPQLKGTGLPCYWGAEFDFPTCPAFSRGVAACAANGLFGFTAQEDDYNRRIRWWLHEVRQASVESDWIISTHGTIFSLATTLRLTARPGDGMIVITPGYGRYKQAADRLGIRTVYSPMRYDPQSASPYSIDFADLEAKMADPSNVLLVFSNPNNPTGTVLSIEELRRIDELSAKYHVTVWCDEIFAEVTPSGVRVPLYAEIAGEQSPAISVTSFGKCMSLTGVNHANVIIKEPKLRNAFITQKYTDHYGSMDPMLRAGLMEACSPEGTEFVRLLNEKIRQNAALIEEALPRLIPGARPLHPTGTFVLWVDYSACISPDGTGIAASPEATRDYLEQQLLFVGDPGSEYGSSDAFMRYNLAMPAYLIKRSIEYMDTHRHHSRKNKF